MLVAPALVRAARGRASHSPLPRALFSAAASCLGRQLAGTCEVHEAGGRHLVAGRRSKSVRSALRRHQLCGSITHRPGSAGRDTIGMKPRRPVELLGGASAGRDLQDEPEASEMPKRSSERQVR
jgi:hypothetical protein